MELKNKNKKLSDSKRKDEKHTFLLPHKNKKIKDEKTREKTIFNYIKKLAKIKNK